MATPKFLFASNPDAKPGDDTSDEGPSERPYETLTALKAKLNLTIDATHRKGHFAEMVTSALACDGAVLIAWQGIVTFAQYRRFLGNFSPTA